MLEFIVPSAVPNVSIKDFLQYQTGSSGGERWTSASSSVFLHGEFSDSSAFQVQQPGSNDLKELCKVCVVTLTMRKVPGM